MLSDLNWLPFTNEGEEEIDLIISIVDVVFQDGIKSVKVTQHITYYIMIK